MLSHAEAERVALLLDAGRPFCAAEWIAARPLLARCPRAPPFVDELSLHSRTAVRHWLLKLRFYVETPGLPPVAPLHVERLLPPCRAPPPAASREAARLHALLYHMLTRDDADADDDVPAPPPPVRDDAAFLALSVIVGCAELGLWRPRETRNAAGLTSRAFLQRRLRATPPWRTHERRDLRYLLILAD